MAFSDMMMRLRQAQNPDSGIDALDAACEIALYLAYNAAEGDPDQILAGYLASNGNTLSISLLQYYDLVLSYHRVRHHLEEIARHQIMVDIISIYREDALKYGIAMNFEWFFGMLEVLCDTWLYVTGKHGTAIAVQGSAP